MGGTSNGLTGAFSPDARCYSSYPTADRFTASFTSEHYFQALEQRRVHQTFRRSPLAIAVHGPGTSFDFCVHRADQYLHYLEREIDLQVAVLGIGQAVNQFHLDGTSTACLGNEHLRQLMAMLQQAFSFAPGGNYTVELDMTPLAAGRIAVLAELGFTHLWCNTGGHEATRETRCPTRVTELVSNVARQARALRFESVAIDLHDPSPDQAADSLGRSLACINAIRPDRIALANASGAHVVTSAAAIRSWAVDPVSHHAAQHRQTPCFSTALQDAGYAVVGPGMLALPDDPLAIARRQGRLHRNLQGYSTRPDSDVMALGVSAISRVGATYSQSARTLLAYGRLLDQGRLPVARGLALSRDDLVRRAVIMAILCQGCVHFESIDLAWFIEFRIYFAEELIALRPFVSQARLAISQAGIEITSQDQIVVCAIAAVFDRYQQADLKSARLGVGS